MAGSCTDGLRTGKIGVLLGGESSEREVSLKTGGAILKALHRKGYEAISLDMRGDWAGIIGNAGIDVAFIALHGKLGEDGAVQGLLEVLGIPYTGSGVMASAVCMSKVTTKRILEGAGVKTPVYISLHLENGEGKVPGEFPFPCVVKPDREGSTIGISIVENEKEMREALTQAGKFDSHVLIEEYIKGREITVGLVNGKVLPAIEIIPQSGFYDYTSKYTKGATEYVCPPQIKEGYLQEAYLAASNASGTLGLRGGARLDFIISEGGDSYFLEVNTIPGMTETSLLPKAASVYGIPFDDLVELILLDAGCGK